MNYHQAAAEKEDEAVKMGLIYWSVVVIQFIGCNSVHLTNPSRSPVARKKLHSTVDYRLRIRKTVIEEEVSKSRRVVISYVLEGVICLLSDRELLTELR